jgi:two-component system phosphate regulon sensor histidine kinase PhoR
MKADDIDSVRIGDIYSQSDDDFADLERAALGLRKKYLRLKRQSREERIGYETVFSGLKEGIVTVDQNLRVISFCTSFMSFFNWAPDKEASNYFLHDIIRDPQIIKSFKDSFNLNHVTRSEVDRFQLFVTPLPSRTENELWCLGVFYDLGEIRKTEKIRIDFVANASHEMRTPLTVIKGYSDLLKKNLIESKDEKNFDLLKPILQSSDQMSDLMNELLNLSKVETGTILTKESVFTKTITEDVLNELQSVLNLQSKKVLIRYDAQTVYANYEAGRQILRNLLINAAKYSGAADQIQVFWKPALHGVCLHVKDNGPGISRDHQDRIFERFYRVDKGRVRDQGGFGLGLALVKHHMQNHGGSIKLISDPIPGSEFICEFPNE